MFCMRLITGYKFWRVNSLQANMIFPVLFVIALLVCSVRSSPVGVTDFDDEPEGNTYGVIVDCGSSGTRAHIFEWDSQLDYPELLNDIEPMRDANKTPITMKIYPGLASLKNDASKASDYMQPIINFILDKIPKESHKATGIYIMGTAGMRLLDSETQYNIMNDIAKELTTRYSFAKVKTDVISGSDEGMYQWITVNSKSKRFGTSDGTMKSDTYGVVEMGGASIQVTFQLKPGMSKMISSSLSQTPEAQLAFLNQVVEPKISRQADERYYYKLVSITFLGLGSNSAREAYVDLLVMQSTRVKYREWYEKYNKIFQYTRFGQYTKDRPLLLTDPCLPRGSFETIERPLKMLSSSNQTVGFIIDDDDETFNVKLHGTGSYSNCRNNLKRMLMTAKNEKMNCKPGEPCTMSLLGTNFAPFQKSPSTRSRMEFLGVGEFYYTTEVMMNLSGAYRRNNVVQKTREICETAYKKLLIEYPHAKDGDSTRVLLECFKAVLVETFLSEGIKMPEDFDKFKTIRTIKGDNLDWTLGAVLDKSQTIELAAESNMG